jgi:calcineurin-like phosphoesterase
MTGPHDSIIGMEREPSLARFLTGLPTKFEPATGNPRLNGIVLEADDKTGRATKITRISYSGQDLQDRRFEQSDRAAPLSRPV